MQIRYDSIAHSTMRDDYSGYSRLQRNIMALKRIAANTSSNSIDNLNKVWAEYIELRELEDLLDQTEIINELHKKLPNETIRAILRSIHPEFTYNPINNNSSLEDSAMYIYRYTKLLNYLVLASKLQKGERNQEIAVLKLTMGQCMRRFLIPSWVQNTDDARNLVRMWNKMSSDYPRSLQLGLFDIRMLVLGAWKTKMGALVPYLYQMACKSQNTKSDIRGFQRLSALVLSFYVGECTKGPRDCVQPSIITGMFEDLNSRAIRLTADHYSMLILYFGKVQNMDEALRVLERGMGDPEVRNTEALYYNTFRAFSWAFSPRTIRKAGGQPLFKQEKQLPQEQLSDQLEYIDELDRSMAQFDYEGDRDSQKDIDISAYTDGTYQQQLATRNNKVPDTHLEAAKACTTLFQTMVDNNVKTGYRTYLELLNCMLVFGMYDKARKIFGFAIETLQGMEIPAHFVVFYIRKTTKTPHQMQQTLLKLIEENTGLHFLMKQYPKRVLADQFGIFKGNLDQFVRRDARPVVEGRGGEFLSQYIYRMQKASRAAAFLKCMAAGNDPGGQFPGYNFLGLKEDGTGLLAVEGEIATTCRMIDRVRTKWLKDAGVIYILLPILPGMPGAEEEPRSIAFIRQLVNDKSLTVKGFVGRLDAGQVKNYDIAMVNQFMRVQYLGLSFQLYVKEREATYRAEYGYLDTGRMHPSFSYARDRKKRGLFWPSFMYEQTNGVMSYGNIECSLDSVRPSTYTRNVVRNLPLAIKSWECLLAWYKKGTGSGRVVPDVNTIGILSLIAIRAKSWSFGERLWDDVFQTHAAVTKVGDHHHQHRNTLMCVRLFKHYVFYLTMATQASASTSYRRATNTSSGRKHVFDDNAISDMFSRMQRHGVEVSSGLLCQGISAGFEVGQFGIASILEQWQLHREQIGLAPEGFLQQSFAHSEHLPEVPEASSSVMELLHDKTSCPRLTALVGQELRNTSNVFP